MKCLQSSNDLKHTYNMSIIFKSIFLLVPMNSNDLYKKGKLGGGLFGIRKDFSKIPLNNIHFKDLRVVARVKSLASMLAY